ncbi:MAG: phage baseplate assembly protein V [Massilia sp.]
MSLMDSAPKETGLEAGGYVKGVAVAVVTHNSNPRNEDVPSSYCVKVSYPWHDQDRNSYWARIAVPMAGGERGVYFLPEVGDEVLVAFEREDLRFPYVIGALWNGKHKPPEDNADGKNNKRTICSRSGHRLEFDDGAKGAVTLKLADGKQLVLDDDGVRLDDGKGNSLAIKTGSGAVTLEAKGKLVLKGASVSIEASAQATLKGGATLKLEAPLININ